ncbi:hypothetical protein Caci_6189 [Catenulispora acidiphila DSM 44928]|uniref:Uncharacterized protein n=1 Tax=Catenulispora acidiphila (strain DSM 44928 / JCM 14897 / NBRC 102108 / NRRL B-24433 / ID139908) TaxID=479433 RepID=C7QIG6_CATAD|nr:hypothetical protein [Catenulispora acidiphila]ACU75043.1 hypothetical protein Caci_6189 [Catenulispora acidiphila DSM 44928]
MRIYLASKRRLIVSAVVLAVGLALLIPAAAMAGVRADRQHSVGDGSDRGDQVRILRHK